MGEQGPVLEAGDGLEHGHRELAAQGGRRQQEIPYGLVEPLQPAGPTAHDVRGDGVARLLHRLPGAVRPPEPAGVEEVRQQHFQQVGLPAARPASRRCTASGISRGPASRHAPVSARTWASSSGLNSLTVAACRRSAERTRSRAAPGSAQGAQEQDGEIGEAVDDVLDDRDGLRVAVVQILQQDRAARLPAQHGQQPQQRLGQLHDRLRASGRPGPAPLRDQPGQRRMVGRELRIGRGAGRPEPGRQRLGERAERHDEPGRGGPAAQHRHAEPVGPVGALTHQPGLSDTGFPDEEQGAPRTPLHGVQGAAQQNDLLVPPDDDRRSGSHGRRLLERQLRRQRTNSAQMQSSWPDLVTTGRSWWSRAGRG